MTLDIDWSLYSHGPNLVGNFLQGAQQAREFKQQRSKDAALKQYATDPAGAIQALSTVDPETAARLVQLQQSRMAMAARSAAQPYIEKGDYAGAMKAGAGDLDLTKRLGEMNDADLKRHQVMGENGARLLYSAAQIKDPIQRAAFIQQNRPDVVAAGIPDDKIDTFNWGDTDTVTAAANRWLAVKDQAAQVARQRQLDMTAQDRSADNARADAALAETQRYHSGQLGQGEQRIGLSRQSAARRGSHASSHPPLPPGFAVVPQ